MIPEKETRSLTDQEISNNLPLVTVGTDFKVSSVSVVDAGSASVVFFPVSKF